MARGETSIISRGGNFSKTNSYRLRVGVLPQRVHASRERAQPKRRLLASRDPGLNRLPQPVQKMEYEQPDDRVQNSQHQRLWQVEIHLLAQQRVGKHPGEELVEEEKEKAQQ